MPTGLSLLGFELNEAKRVRVGNRMKMYFESRGNTYVPCVRWRDLYAHTIYPCRERRIKRFASKPSESGRILCTQALLPVERWLPWPSVSARKHAFIGPTLKTNRPPVQIVLGPVATHGPHLPLTIARERILTQKQCYFLSNCITRALSLHLT